MSLYATNEKSLQSLKEAGLSPRGTVEDLLQRTDVVVDATADNSGASNKKMYEQAGVRAVFQGGEEHALAGFSFVAQCNFEQAKGRRMIRVVSCNATALCRVLGSIDGAFGIAKARAVIARGAADPDEVRRGPIDAVVFDPPAIPSRHASDVQYVLPKLNLVTMAYKIPTTHMHLQSLIVTPKKSPSTEAVVETLAASPRTMLVDTESGFQSTANIIDMAREMGRSRNDLFEAVVWRDSVSVIDGDVFLFVATHQEAIVIPENIDAIRALTGGYSREDSMRMTDESLGIVHRQR
jgi:glyceraldehyde-3-phosphate dehydrogenase (NAD(P))